MVRMAKLDRLIALVHALADTPSGLTLDDMARLIGVDRRTAERMRDVIALHFDLEEIAEDRRKRFLISENLRPVYTRPNAGELAALKADADAHRAAGRIVRAEQLDGLLAKLRRSLDRSQRLRLEPDLDALARLQRAHVAAGPNVTVAAAAIASIQQAIMAGCCVEFDYASERSASPRFHRVVPHGLLHDAASYLVGKSPGDSREPTLFRIDRMSNVVVSQQPGCPPDDWDIDAWLDDSFGLWRGERHSISLRILPAAAAKARAWRFHRKQQIAALDDGGLRVTFEAGGLRELADHLFGWGGELVIEGPPALITMMRERIAAALTILPPDQPSEIDQG
jgi:proteasome accessory factor B